MIRIRLTSTARAFLWIGGGGLLGLAAGAALVDPARVNPTRDGSLFGFWVLLVAVYLALVLALGREKDEPRVPVPVQRVAQAAPQAVRVSFSLPDVPDGFPLVMGRAEPLRVRVAVARNGAPAPSAAVRLKATMGGETLKGEGVTGTDGSVEFTLEPEGTGELSLHAEALLEGARGDARTSVSIVQYEDEITRLFGEFRTYATNVLGPDAHADTAREIAERLRPVSTPEATRALLELARIYELVAYGEREADRRLYLAVMEQLLTLEQVDLQAPAEASAPAAAPRGA